MSSQIQGKGLDAQAVDVKSPSTRSDHASSTSSETPDHNHGAAKSGFELRVMLLGQTLGPATISFAQSSPTLEEIQSAILQRFKIQSTAQDRREVRLCYKGRVLTSTEGLESGSSVVGVIYRPDAPQTAEYTVLLKFLGSGRSIKVAVDGDMTIDDLKMKIAEEVGIDPTVQRLAIGCSPLKAKDTENVWASILTDTPISLFMARPSHS